MEENKVIGTENEDGKVTSNDPATETESQIENPASGEGQERETNKGGHESAPKDGQVYTAAQLDELKAQWQREHEQAEAAKKDFEKMTPEEQAQARLEQLEKQLADRDLTDYARTKIGEAALPEGALKFVKGASNTDTDTLVKEFSELLAAGVQAGVEARFKQNGYTPKVGGAGSSGKEEKKTQRGVSIVK